MEPDRDAKLPYAERIAKLLRKAENTDNENEADAYTDKAQQLMVRYAISEELLAKAQGRQVQDHVIQDTIHYTGIFNMALFDIGNAVALANNCKTLIAKGNGTNVTLYVIGFQSDVSNVKVLAASLQVQASTAMQRWYRGINVEYKTPMQKFKVRREFIMSFARGLKTRLVEANKAGVTEAVQDEVTRSGETEQAVRTSTDLVLVSKKARVEDWMDEHYGSSLRSVSRRYSSGGHEAAQAGYEAGRKADLGNPRLGGKKAIGS